MTPVDAHVENREFARLFPYYCDGSRRGVGEYLSGVAQRSGLDIELVSVRWRTSSTIDEFVRMVNACVRREAAKL
jgi:hypothetical protein